MAWSEQARRAAAEARDQDLGYAREQAYTLAKMTGKKHHMEMASALSPHHNPLIATRMGKRRR